MAGADAGRVSLGTIAMIAPYVLPQGFSGLCRKYPGIQLTVVEDVTSVLLTQLRNGMLDLALLAYPVSGNDLVYEEMLSEPMYLAVPDSHRIASRKQSSLREIENDPFLLLKDGHCFRESAIEACQRARFKPNVVFESGQFATILALVTSGTGVSVIPEMAVDHRKGCKFIRIDDPRARRRIVFVRLKHHFHTKAQRAVVEHFKGFARTKD
jgi:LysR family hydrogen peroxide-inducible transcriptional activator